MTAMHVWNAQLTDGVQCWLAAKCEADRSEWHGAHLFHGAYMVKITGGVEGVSPGRLYSTAQTSNSLGVVGTKVVGTQVP